jgi:hypothetical protein
VNAETKEQLKQQMHTHSPNKLRNFKQTLSACQKADGSYFLGQEKVPMMECLQKGNIKKSAEGHS